MQYDQVAEAVFLERPNRFIAWVRLAGKEEIVHVKNTGRCRELLVPGCRVYLAKGSNPARKTRYDLIAVEKKREGKTSLLINMDAQAPNAAVGEFLAAGGVIPAPDEVRAEVRFGESRFDFYVRKGNRRAFVEVKGVTLEKDGAALFPDAPTLRGVKHLNELAGAVREGYEAYVFFLIQMKGVEVFRPNDAMHPAFGAALRKAMQSGVKILAYDAAVTADSMRVCDPVSVDPGGK